MGALVDDGVVRERMELRGRGWSCEGDDGVARERMELQGRGWSCEGDDY